MTDEEINNLLDQTTFKKYTREQAFNAMQIYVSKGLLEAERLTGISRRNILNWKNPGRNSKYCKNNTQRHYEQYQKKWIERYKNDPQKVKDTINKSKQKQGDDGATKRKEYMQQWRNDNRDKYQKYLNEYEKKRRKEDLNFKIKKQLRDRFKYLIKNKTATIDKYLGCSVEDFRRYMELKFSPNMTWENHGTYWHIDHIKPLDSFDLSDETHLEVALHYTNLQPLEKNENLSKGSKIIAKTLGIISCSKSKKDYSCTVDEMYGDSTFFKSYKKYCLQKYHNCKVLSAKHGMMDLYQNIEPYESITLCEGFRRKDTIVMSHADRRIWALKVYNSFDWNAYEEIHFHVSKHYWRYLQPLFESHTNIFYHPMGVGIGINIQNIQNQTI
jgi:hypothetical protein